MGRSTAGVLSVRGGVAALAVVLHLACNGSPTAPSTATVTRIDVALTAAGSLSFAPGESLQLKATASYKSGKPSDVTGTVTWQSSDPKTVVVTPAGVAKAGQIGAAEIMATLDGVSGTLHLDVSVAPLNCSASSLSSPSSVITAFANFVPASVVTPFTDCKWIAQSDAGWLTTHAGSLIRDPDTSGNGSLGFEMPANDTTLNRTAHITVTFTDKTTLVHTVTQLPPPTCAFRAVPVEMNIPHSGGSVTFDVEAISMTGSPCAWTAVSHFPHVADGWHFSVSGSGVGNGKVTTSSFPDPTITSTTSFPIDIIGTNPLDPSPQFKLKLDRP